MREIGAFEVNIPLDTLIDCPAAGEEVPITRHGEAGTGLAPAMPGFDHAKAAQAARGLRDASRGITLGGISIRDLVNEGRP